MPAGGQALLWWLLVEHELLVLIELFPVGVLLVQLQLQWLQALLGALIADRSEAVVCVDCRFGTVAATPTTQAAVRK